ncbi:unnamed protein product [Urochloa humidicola]
MEFIPGEAWRRPNHVAACAAHTSEVKEAERDLQLHTIVGVQVDSRAQLSCELVQRDVLQQLRIPPQALQVSRISTTTFLLRFQTLALRNAAHARKAFVVGRTSLHLMPWGHHIGAGFALAKLFYRAHVCLEGVPGHAHNVESVQHLLPKQSFVESIDLVREREDERGCFILWIWCKDPEAISVLGTLQIEEPMTLPAEYDNMSDDDRLTIPRSEEL